MLRTLCVLPICAAMVLGFPPQLAFAQTTQPNIEALSPDRRRELANLIDLAESRFKKDDFKRALDYFSQAYEIFPHARLLYKRAVCLDRLKDAPKALKLYQEYLKQMPKAPEAATVKERVEALAKVQQRKRDAALAASTSLRVKSNPTGAVVRLHSPDNSAAGTTPTADLPIEPGKIKLYLSREGYEPFQATVEVKPGEAAEHSFTLKKDMTVKPDPRGKSGGRKNSAAPWVLLGVGAIATGASVFFFTQHDPDMQRGQDVTEEEFETNQTYETAAYASGAVAIVGLGGAIAMWVIQSKQSGQGSTALDTSKPAPRLTPSVWAAPGSAGVHVLGRF